MRCVPFKSSFGVFGGIIKPLDFTDTSTGWIWGAAFRVAGKSDGEASAFGDVEGDANVGVPIIMPKSLMVATVGSYEAILSAAELTRNQFSSVPNVGKLASALINGGMAATWVAATYK
jgi:hypothetical protein